MAAQLDLETRLRGYAQEFDRDLPTTAMLERRIMARVAITPREERRGFSLRRELALAGLVVVAVALLAFGVVRLRAINQPVTAHPKGSVVISPGIKGAAPATVAFVSGSVGWIAEMPPPANPTQPQAGPTTIFATTDAGVHWQRQLTWDGPPPAQMRFSADGREGLVVGISGVPLFHTSDGGAHWHRMTLPAEERQVGGQVFFLNPREGWVLAYLQEATPGFVGLFHTTDSGAHWTRVARLDVGVVFAHGQTGGSTQGSLVFKDSSTGWLISAAAGGSDIQPSLPFAYITRDGGLTWQVQTITPPNSAQLDTSSVAISPPLFFTARNGVLGLTPISLPGPNSGAPATLQATYVYTTTDGGAHWSYAVRLPAPVFVGTGWSSFIDLRHWLLYDGTRLIRTSDGGQHWSSIPGGLPSGATPVTLAFNSQSTGWAVLYLKGAPALYRTTDGGSHWSEVSLPSAG